MLALIATIAVPQQKNGLMSTSVLMRLFPKSPSSLPGSVSVDRPEEPCSTSAPVSTTLSTASCTCMTSSHSKTTINQRRGKYHRERGPERERKHTHTNHIVFQIHKCIRTMQNIPKETETERKTHTHTHIHYTQISLCLCLSLQPPPQL